MKAILIIMPRLEKRGRAWKSEVGGYEERGI